MKLRSSKASMLAIVLALGLVLLIGYTAPGRNTNIANQLQSQQLQNFRGNLTEYSPPGSIPQNIPVIDKKKSDNIRKQLNMMDGLSRAEVIVMGNTALVGYRTTKKVQGANAYRTMIINKVKQADASIANVFVSESADITSRINKLSRDIANQRPANEVIIEAKQLLNRAAPTKK